MVVFVLRMLRTEVLRVRGIRVAARHLDAAMTRTGLQTTVSKWC